MNHRKDIGSVAGVAVAGLVTAWLSLRSPTLVAQTSPRPQAEQVAPVVRDVPPAGALGAPPVMTSISGRDNPEAISFEHGAFSYLQMLDRMPPDDNFRADQRAFVLKRIRRITGVDAPTADKVLAYMRDGFQSYETMGKQLVADRCAQRSALRSISLIAARMESDAKTGEAKRDSLVHGLENIIGNDGMNRLKEFVESDVKKGMSILSGDAEAVLLELHQTPEQIMAMLCRDK